MYVYRLETSKGWGPYRPIPTWGLSGPDTVRLKHLQTQLPRHAVPTDPRLLLSSGLTKEEVENCFILGWIFAWKDKRLLDKFCKDIPETELEHFGLRKTKIWARDILHLSDGQVLFNPKSCSRFYTV